MGEALGLEVPGIAMLSSIRKERPALTCRVGFSRRRNSLTVPIGKSIFLMVEWRGPISCPSTPSWIATMSECRALNRFSAFRKVEFIYFDGYRDHSINTQHEIFLTLKQNILALRAFAKSDRSSGIASPDLNVAAISRVTGRVGGRKNSALKNGELDFNDTVAGLFNPAQFVGDAKLLGVVPLWKIVEVAAALQTLTQAPKLLDETLFGVRDDFKLVQMVAASLLDALYGRNVGLIALLEAAIQKADDFLAAAGLSLDVVYKSLTQALAPMRGNPAEIEHLLKAVVAAKTAGEIREPIGKLVPNISTLLDAVVHVIKDPVPDAFEEVIAKVRTIFETVFQCAESAILPFFKGSLPRGEARFVLALASRDRPFLISSPPYGGGGGVTITCTLWCAS